MAKTETVRARVEPELKHDVEMVLSKLGLTTSDAITLLMKQITLTGGLPFPVRIPNRETRGAIAEARSGKNRKVYATFKEMADDVLED